LTPLSPPDPPLTDGRIRLDPLAPADRAESWAMAQDDTVRRYTLLPSDADEAWVGRWIERYVAAWGDGSRAGFAIRDVEDGSYLGFAAIVHLELDARQGEIGYMVAPAARGKGVAAVAVELLTRWGFDDLGLQRLELRIDVSNAASVRVAERAGYRLDGVLRSLAFKEGRRTDTGVWSRLPTDRLSL
jgi:RimJ/RimL family protein N-acetyltransferase